VAMKDSGEFLTAIAAKTYDSSKKGHNE
jgi:hypothetical protein